MTVKVNEKYRLKKEYYDSLSVKPQSEFIEIKMIYNNIITYSDGISQFSDRVSNVIPNLLEPSTKFNTTSIKKIISQEQIIKIVPVIDTPIVEEPVIIEEPIAPIVPDPSSPYGNDYI